MQSSVTDNTLPGYRRRYRNKVKVGAGEQRYATRTGGQTLALRSLGEVAEMLGCSRAAVHQVERTAFYKLRVALAKELRETNPELAMVVARLVA